MKKNIHFVGIITIIILFFTVHVMSVLALPLPDGYKNGTCGIRNYNQNGVTCLDKNHNLITVTTVTCAGTFTDDDGNEVEVCCPSAQANLCQSVTPTPPAQPIDPLVTPNPPPAAGNNNQAGTGNLDVFFPPDAKVFEELNPLKGGGLAGTLNSPGAIVSRILLFAFPLAGLILFVMIVWGGFEMIMGATSKGMEAGRQRVTAAIVGFILLFSSYWIMQIIQYVFGVVIL